MIKWNWTIVFTILLLAGCSGHNPALTLKTVTVTALAGSTIEHVSVNRQGADLHLEVTEVDPAGTFFAVSDLGSCVISGQDWSSTDGLLYLAETTPDGIEIGIVPLEGYSGGRVSAEISLAPGKREVASAPTGYANTVQDLTVIPVDEFTYRLTWTEVNIGDYNADGLVGVSDLTPIGIHYGQKIGADNAYYWVDGTRDGYILVDDITPIGQHYGTSVKGYVVWRNAEKVLSTEGGEITASRPDATAISGPPTYQLELTGEASDSWYVTPASQDSPDSVVVGQASVTIIAESFINDPDLTVALDFAGPETFDVSFRSSSVINDGHQILRIIDPSDIVNNITIDQRLNVPTVGRVLTDEEGNTARFDQLPRGIPLFLEIIFAPTVNLNNAIPRYMDGQEIPVIIPDEYFNVVAVPFELPEDLTEPMQFLGSVLLDKQTLPGPGYNLITTYDCICNGDALGATGKVHNLDFPAGRVRQASTDADLVYAAEMTDSDKDSVSDRMLDVTQDMIEYGEIDGSGYILEGEISESLSLENGSMFLTNVLLFPGPVAVSPLNMYFNEATRIGKLGVDVSLDTIEEIDMSTIQVGDTVRVRFYLFRYEVDDEEYTKLWADTIAVYVSD